MRQQLWCCCLRAAACPPVPASPSAFPPHSALSATLFGRARASAKSARKSTAHQACRRGCGAPSGREREWRARRDNKCSQQIVTRPAQSHSCQALPITLAMPAPRGFGRRRGGAFRCQLSCVTHMYSLHRKFSVNCVSFNIFPRLHFMFPTTFSPVCISGTSHVAQRTRVAAGLTH